MSTDQLSRRSMLAVSSLLGLAPAALAMQPGSGTKGAEPAVSFEHFPRQNPDLVRDMVGASHGNLARVRELVTRHPTLAKGAWDWGFGDWESALGAASHVGNREIAMLLIEHGARPDLFTFAMLGDLASVRAMIEARPGIQRIPGPHGIPLLDHARAGGDAAKGVYEYLLSLKDAGEGPKSEPLSEGEMQRLVGSYAGTGSAAGVLIEIKIDKGALHLQRKPQPARRLFHLGNGEFYPTGAPQVRIVFAAGMNGPGTLTVRDHDVVLTAVASS
ncbi:MAG TPA: hypothetical protein VD997_03810 [Phycisphaerales bacterium]|nr:hypothetical protein [Phycisphaerales bacterium]